MGVSLGYFSTKPVPQQDHLRLLSSAAETNRAYAWWCEPIWISAKPDETGIAFGFTKLFRNIEDENTDTYMAFLDICEIIKWLSVTSQQLGIEWRLEIEGAPFGGVANGSPNEELQGNISTFLEMFPGNFEPLKARSREEIFAAWSDK